MSLTLVMLNWKRPQLVASLLRHYQELDLVAEIVLWDAAPSAEYQFTASAKLSKLRLIRDHHDRGLPARFAAAALGRNRDLFITDDDIELPHESVRRLYDAYLGRGLRASVVGLYGRNLPPGDMYNCRTVEGPCDIVLTRALMCRRETASAALPLAQAMADTLGGEPRGNGEDIVLSFVATALSSGARNVAVMLPHTNHEQRDPNAISNRFPAHKQHRTEVVEWCRKHVPGSLEWHRTDRV